MASFRETVSGHLTKGAYRPLRILSSKYFWRQKYWELLKSLPEKDLTVDTDHGRLSFSSRDKFIGRSLYTAGSYGYASIFKAIDILKSQSKLSEVDNGYLIDIGANVGTVCIPLLLKGVFAKALAFEPEPRNYRYLARNIDQNQLTERVQAFQVALSSTVGELELEICEDNYGDHRIRTSGAVSSQFNQLDESGRRVIKVPVQTLDQTIQSLDIKPEQVDLLWMDVQGHEGHIFQGAGSLIASGVPIVFEFWPYGLKSAGLELEWFMEFVSTQFTYLWDLGADNPEAMPASDIRRLFEIFNSDNANDQTDVLVF